MAEATPPQPPSRLDRIEAALERITERHEALAQSVELSHRDTEEFKAQVRRFMSRTEALLEKDAGNILTLAGVARDALASIQSLERLATDHQTRLDGHEKRIDDLEK
jgi:phage shock protein A